MVALFAHVVVVRSVVRSRLGPCGNVLLLLTVESFLVLRRRFGSRSRPCC